jgi:hypothetical protein
MIKKKLIEALNRPNKKELTTITWEKNKKKIQFLAN